MRSPTHDAGGGSHLGAPADPGFSLARTKALETAADFLHQTKDRVGCKKQEPRRKLCGGSPSSPSSAVAPSLSPSLFLPAPLLRALISRRLPALPAARSTTDDPLCLQQSAVHPPPSRASVQSQPRGPLPVYSPSWKRESWAGVEYRVQHEGAAVPSSQEGESAARAPRSSCEARRPLVGLGYTQIHGDAASQDQSHPQTKAQAGGCYSQDCSLRS